MNKAKAAIYCRVARADEMALENQESLLSRYAENNGYTDCFLFRDNGASGLSLDRSGFNALMTDIRDGHIKTVIVKDLSRIARDSFLLQKWFNEVDGLGVELVSLMDGEYKEGQKALLKDFVQHMTAAVISREQRVSKTS